MRALVKKGKQVRNRESRQRQIRAQEAKEAKLTRTAMTSTKWEARAEAAAKKIRHDKTFTDPVTRQLVADRERLAGVEFWNSLKVADLFKALPTTLPVLWEKVGSLGIKHGCKMIPLISSTSKP